MLWLNIILLVFFALILVGAGTLMVRSLTKIATFLKLTGFVIGFILMAFATSIPELFVGIMSAIQKTPSISLGNIIGANIIDLTLVTGIAILLSNGIKIESEKTKKDAMYMFGVASLAMLLSFLGGQLSRIDGIILIFVFLIYARHLIKEGKVFTKELENKTKRWDVILSVFIFIFALVTLLYAAESIVKIAKDLAIEMSVPPILIGLLIIAFSTTLPELVFTSRAAMMGHPSLGIGNVLGSVVVNSTLILGIVALIQPITAHFLTFLVSAMFLLTASFLFFTFAGLTDRLGKRIGISLIMFYVLFLITEVYLRTIA